MRAIVKSHKGRLCAKASLFVPKTIVPRATSAGELDVFAIEISALRAGMQPASPTSTRSHMFFKSR